jgi:hypothetical protein
MAARIDWVPSQEEKLIELLTIWLAILADPALQAAYGWPSAECTLTLAAFTAFINGRTAYQAAPTKANHTAKEELKKAAVDALRKFARKRIRNNSTMTDAQKQELGVTVADSEPSPAPVPDAGPDSEAVISAREPGVVKVRYLSAKPYGVDSFLRIMEPAALRRKTPPPQKAVRRMCYRERYVQCALKLVEIL